MKRELFEQYNCLQCCLENDENEKGNTNISVESNSNSNCCTRHKHNKMMFFISPREVIGNYTPVFKSE